ncbi:MAG: VOC family protein [Pseudomonadota bacterium]
MTFEFDHVVIGAADLQQGAAWSEETFGAPLGPGGRHPSMGTHNLLARTPMGYVEIIARDPWGRAPKHPRWFALDEPAQRARLEERPRPIAWVLATADLDAAMAGAPWPMGPAYEVSRDDLTWRIAAPAGAAALEGVLPCFIEWPERLDHRAPRGRMAPLGPPHAPMALGGLRLRHPEPERIERLLAALGAERIALAAGFALSVSRGAEPSLEAAFRPARLSRSV